VSSWLPGCLIQSLLFAGLVVPAGLTLYAAGAGAVCQLYPLYSSVPAGSEYQSNAILVTGFIPTVIGVCGMLFGLGDG